MKHHWWQDDLYFKCGAEYEIDKLGYTYQLPHVSCITCLTIAKKGYEYNLCKNFIENAIQTTLFVDSITELIEGE